MFYKELANSNPDAHPVFESCYKKMISSTKKLGQVLVELALHDGTPLDSEGFLEGGRTISNVGIRRLAGI